MKSRRVTLETLVLCIGLVIGAGSCVPVPVPTPDAASPQPSKTIFATPSAPIPAENVLEFEEGPCPFQVPSGASREVQCGFVTVPEDHDNPAGPTIRLAVVVVRNASSARPPEPVMLLAGGPGEKVVASA